ncbi:hypothetical protein KIL84_010026, partial [Mauremys mutica]
VLGGGIPLPRLMNIDFSNADIDVIERLSATELGARLVRGLHFTSRLRERSRPALLTPVSLGIGRWLLHISIREETSRQPLGNIKGSRFCDDIVAVTDSLHGGERGKNVLQPIFPGDRKGGVLGPEGLLGTGLLSNEDKLSTAPLGNALGSGQAAVPLKGFLTIKMCQAQVCCRMKDYSEMTVSLVEEINLPGHEGTLGSNLGDEGAPRTGLPGQKGAPGTGLPGNDSMPNIGLLGNGILPWTESLVINEGFLVQEVCMAKNVCLGKVLSAMKLYSAAKQVCFGTGLLGEGGFLGTSRLAKEGLCGNGSQISNENLLGEGGKPSEGGLLGPGLLGMIYFRLFGKIQAALSIFPVSRGQFVELDLQPQRDKKSLNGYQRRLTGEGALTRNTLTGIGAKMFKVCSILLFCTLLTLPQDSQGYRPELIIRQKTTKKDFLDFVSHVLHGQSLADEQLSGDPGAGGTPVAGSQPSLLGSLLSAVGRLLGEIIEVEVLKNIIIAIRRGDPSLVLEHCKIPLGYMDIKVLKASSLPLENEILTLVTRVLDRTLPQILQKTLCPVISAVVSGLDGTALSTARLATSAPGGNSPSSVFNMSFNPDAIVLELTGRSLIEQTLPLLPENTTEVHSDTIKDTAEDRNNTQQYKDAVALLLPVTLLSWEHRLLSVPVLENLPEGLDMSEPRTWGQEPGTDSGTFPSVTCFSIIWQEKEDYSPILQLAASVGQALGSTPDPAPCPVKLWSLCPSLTLPP